MKYCTQKDEIAILRTNIVLCCHG